MDLLCHRELKFLQVTQCRSRSLEIASFDRSYTRSYSSSIVGLTMAVSWIVFEKNANFSYPLPFNFHDYLESLRISKILTQTVAIPKLY